MTSEAQTPGDGAGHGTASTKANSGIAQNPSSNDLQNMRKVAEAATPGPWRVDPTEHAFKVTAPNTEPSGYGRPYSTLTVCAQTARLTPEGKVTNAANATFIATFDPPTVLSLLNQITALQGENERLEEALVAINGFAGHDDRCAKAMWAFERRECDCGYTSAHQKLPAALLNREG